MNVPAWVIDTNVLVSAILTPGGNCDKILRAAINGKIRLAWSSQMLMEYRHVLLRPKFNLSPSVVSAILTAFGPADQIAVADAPKLPDSDDEIFLATALNTSAQILVTGNTIHFPKEICAPVQVLSPTQAVQKLTLTL